VFPKASSAEHRKPIQTPPENHQKTIQNSALEIEVKMLREQIERMDLERERERSQLTDQIEALKEHAERQSADHRQALAALTDQREKAQRSPQRGLWARLIG
jgi:competence protein ComGC